MVAYPFRLPSGFAGQVTRGSQAAVEAGMFNAASMPAAFAIAVQEDANGIRALAATDTAINGFLVRPYPISGNGTDGLGVATPIVTLPGSTLKRGYILAKLGGAAAAVKDGPVFIRVGNLGGAKVLGQPEAAADFSAGLSAVAKVGNTGNGTFTADPTTPLLANYQPGVYVLTFTSATAWTLTDPQGHSLPGGVNGAANADQIKFVTAAGGAAFVAGDQFNITVAPATIALDSKSYFTGPADASGIVELAFNI
jgi:hypothetical protein